MTKNSTRSFVLLSACALSLAACAPNYFADGYTHHAKPYKSQNPPPSSRFTESMRATMGPEQADGFRMAVYGLTEKLTLRAGMPPKAVHVVTPTKMTPLHSNIDNDLRESLRHLGYTLSDTPEGAYAFAYSAVIIKEVNGKPVADDGVTPNTRIALYVYDKAGEGSNLLTQEVGDFYIKGADKLNLTFMNFDGLETPALDDSRTGRYSE